MIASVRGRVLHAGAERVVVECGGVGLELHVAAATAAGLRVGEEHTVAAALVVREDALTLFGFASQDERALFDQLLGVTGIGPRLALAILGTLGADGVRRAVTIEDVAALARTPGVGRKSAQRLVLELRDRLGATGTTLVGLPTAMGRAAGWAEQVRQALTGLGWTPAQADAAVAVVTPVAEEQQSTGGPDVAALLRLALRSLDRTA
jgi:Holliday junction DNA helicase RuvA